MSDTSGTTREPQNGLSHPRQPQGHRRPAARATTAHDGGVATRGNGGDLVTGGGGKLATNPTGQCAHEYPHPNGVLMAPLANMSQIKRFHGLAGFYR